MGLFTIFLVMCMVTWGSSRSLVITNDEVPVNVMNYGAVGDGITDDSKAFTKAWEAVCGATSYNPTLEVPWGKTFFLKSTKFQGPCKSSNLHIQIKGNILAPSKNPAHWEGKDLRNWLAFADINGFIIDGYGQIDGQGSKWWQSCVNPQSCMRPSALGFYGCSNFEVNGLKSINSQRNHISIANCENATLSNLQIFAPDTSPNTDGIDISNSKNITIQDSNIGTGDDCIAVGTGCSHIRVNGVTCGPGHGISIGSLGKHGEMASVEDVKVRNSTLNATLNGVRIKTWQGGSGFARNISFIDITLIAADNPIIIDQFYCPFGTCNNETKAVQISDVFYIGVHGTSIRDEAINLKCSEIVGCNNILLGHINITSTTPAKEKTFSSCLNAHGKYADSIPSVDCLS